MALRLPAKPVIQKESKNIRLFKSPYLEALTHVHPITPLLLWLPISIGLLWLGRRDLEFGLIAASGTLALGVLAWTIVEYALHRFAFHYSAKSSWGQWIVYLFHGNHHDDPHDATRLVMPPTVSLALGAIIYLSCRALFPAGLSEFFFVGMIWGYLAYDYIHYGVHHFEPRSRIGKYLKRYHYLHHWDHEGSKWGVSSPLWDLVFQTYHPKRARHDK